MLILPFGGVVISDDTSATPWQRAWIGMGGPMVGSIGGLVGFYLYLRYGHAYFLVFAFFSAILNLSNLAPIFPLDGGRIVKPLDRRLLLIGIPIYAVFLYNYVTVITILMGVAFFIALLNNLKKIPPCESCDTPNHKSRDYCVECGKPLKLNPSERTKLSACYVGLIFALLISFWPIMHELKDNVTEVKSIVLKK